MYPLDQRQGSKPSALKEGPLLSEAENYRTERESKAGKPQKKTKWNAFALEVSRRALEESRYTKGSTGGVDESTSLTAN